MIDKNKIKEVLEKERTMLLDQLNDIGKLNPETNEWETVPEELTSRETDQNDMADRFEDFEARSNTMEVLEAREKNVLKAIQKLENNTFGKCEECGKRIEPDRLEANPAAEKCKEHMN